MTGVKMEISDQDRRLLSALQGDGSASLAEIAARVGMSTSTVWRRMQDLESGGVIRGRVVLVDPKKAGVGLCIFATVRLSDHAEAAISGFARIVDSHPEIMEAHAVSGTADYILKIRCADVEAYESFMSQTLLRSPLVKSVVSSFSLRTLKYTTELPL